MSKIAQQKQPRKEIKIEKLKKIEAFYTMAYDDYIASRVLLNSNYFLQGAILASTAIEKYFKGLLLAVRDEKNKVPRVHLDNFEELKNQFVGTEYEELFEKFDDYFIEELCNVYGFRYYDNFSNPTSIGFLVNQFLGELDYMVFLFNLIFKSYNNDGSERVTKYARYKDEYNRDLYKSNFILNRVEKDDFMNRESKGFSFYINPNKLEPIILESRGYIKPGTTTVFKTQEGAVELPVPKYSGKIFRIIMRGKDDPESSSA